MSYNRNRTAQTGVGSLGAHINTWLVSLAQAIVSQGSSQNRHMSGSVDNRSWYRVDVAFEGEDLSDMPASGFAMIEFDHNMVVARCAYGHRDASFKLGLGDDTDKFIEYVAQFVTGLHA